MSIPLIVIVSLIYAAVAVSLVIDQRYGMALMFLCYALANVGVILALNEV